MKPADSDQIARIKERSVVFFKVWLNKQPATWQQLSLDDFWLAFAASERQAVIEDCAKMADQIAQSCSACSYSREKHGEEPSFCENFGCSSFADLAAAIRSME